MIRASILLIILIGFYGCSNRFNGEPQPIERICMILSDDTIPADGKSHIDIRTELPLRSDQEKRKLIYTTDFGTFGTTGSKEHTETGVLTAGKPEQCTEIVFDDKVLYHTQKLVAPLNPNSGFLKVNAPDLSGVKRRVTFINACPESIRFVSEKRAIASGFGDPIEIMAILERGLGKPSVGNMVKFELLDSSENPVVDQSDLILSQQTTSDATAMTKIKFVAGTLTAGTYSLKTTVMTASCGTKVSAQYKFVIQ